MAMVTMSQPRQKLRLFGFPSLDTAHTIDIMNPTHGIDMIKNVIAQSFVDITGAVSGCNPGIIDGGWFRFSFIFISSP